MVAGDFTQIEKLVQKLEPDSFVAIYAGLVVGTTNPYVWVGLGASVVAYLACTQGEADVQLGITVGAMSTALMSLNHPIVCPLGPNLGYLGMPNAKCSQSYGASFTLICCYVDLVTGESSCR